jgi:hypothetical protein
MNDCESLYSTVRCTNSVGGVVLATDSKVRSPVYRISAMVYCYIYFICSLLSDVYSYRSVILIERLNRLTKTGLSFDEWYS